VNISYTSRRIIMIMIVLAALISLGGAVFFHNGQAEDPILLAMHFSFGVLLTTCLNCVKIILLEKTAARVVELNDEARGKNFARMQYFFRFLLTIAVFLAAAFVPFIDLFGAIFGIFTMQLAMYVWRFTSPKEFAPVDEQPAQTASTGEFRVYDSHEDDDSGDVQK